MTMNSEGKETDPSLNPKKRAENVLTIFDPAIRVRTIDAVVPCLVCFQKMDGLILRAFKDS